MSNLEADGLQKQDKDKQKNKNKNKHTKKKTPGEGILTGFPHFCWPRPSLYDHTHVVEYVQWRIKTVLKSKELQPDTSQVYLIKSAVSLNSNDG